MRIFFIILLSQLLFSCTSLETLKRSSAKGDQFQMYLFEHYKEFAEREAEDYDWLDSQHFIDKAMLIVYGTNVEPENIENWKIADGYRSMLAIQREALMTFVKNPDIRAKYPKQLAEAQFGFDCLLEELEEDLQEKNIKKCQTLLDTNLEFLVKSSTKVNEPPKVEEPKEELKTAIEPVKEEIKEKPENKPEENKVERPLETKQTKEIIESAKEFFTYRIFFEFNSDKLTPGSKNALKKIAKEIKDMKTQPEEISLNGYTDKAGAEAYNLELSRKRANSVKEFLAKQGLDKKKIIIYAFGESDSQITAPNNSKEPASRRVEIAIVD